MHWNESSLFIALVLAAIFAWLLSQSSGFRRAFILGASFWSRWLPVSAATLYLLLIGQNLVTSLHLNNAFNLSRFFTGTEFMLFFFLGAAFLTPVGPLVAWGTLFYFIERLLTHTFLTETPAGVFLLLGSTTTLAMLGDKLPWLHHQNPLSHHMRQIIAMMFGFAAIAMSLITLIVIKDFSRWFSFAFSFNISKTFIFIGLVMLMFGWLSVLIGQSRELLVPILTLPTLIILAYNTTWPNVFLVIPFMLCCGISLASVDRRVLIRRRT